MTDPMQDLIPAEVIKVLPPNVAAYASLIAVVVFALGRAYHAIRGGGGLIALWRGLLYGTNSPKSTNDTTK